LPVQSTQQILTGAAFTLSPQAGDQPPSFDRCVITNQSGYQLSAEVGPTTLILEPWTKDIVPTYGLSIDIRPIESALIIEGAPAYVNALWLAPKDAFDPSALPSTVAAAPTIAGTSPGINLGASKIFWSFGRDSRSITNSDVILTLDSCVGWGVAATIGVTSYTVPAGKQLVITNIQLSVRPADSANLIRIRNSTTISAATVRFVLATQISRRFGSPTTGTDFGASTFPYFGESSLVLAAGETFAASAVSGSASGNNIDIFFIGFLQDVT
jgi:hypothetical protein